MISSYEIVDVKGLSEVLCCAPATIRKTWREYPHIFIGQGKTAKSARFKVSHVLSYLMERDYQNGIPRSKNKKMDRRFKDIRVSKREKKRLQDQKRSKKVGERQERKASESGIQSKPIENFKSMFALS